MRPWNWCEVRVSDGKELDPSVELRVMVAAVSGELPSKGLVHVSWKPVVVMAPTDKSVGAKGGTGGEGKGRGEGHLSSCY